MCAGRRCACYHGEPWDGLTSEIRDRQNNTADTSTRGTYGENRSVDTAIRGASTAFVGLSVPRTNNPDTRPAAMITPPQYAAPDDDAYIGAKSFAPDGVIPGTLYAGERQGIGRRILIPKKTSTPRGSMLPEAFYPSRRRPTVQSLGEVTQR